MIASLTLSSFDDLFYLYCVQRATILQLYYAVNQPKVDEGHI